MTISGESPTQTPLDPKGASATIKPELSKDSVEFLVVLAFAFLPTLIYSIASYISPPPQNSAAFSQYFIQILGVARLVIPLLYIVHLSGRRFGSIGLVKPQWIDLFWTLVFLVAGYAAAYVVQWISQAVLPDSHASQRTVLARFFPHPKNISDYTAIVVGSLAGAFGEELLSRGYVWTKWRQLSGSNGQAIALSTALFAIMHVYQGIAGVLNAAAFGLIYAVGFSRLRRLFPFVLAHALTDIILLSRF